MRTTKRSLAFFSFLFNLRHVTPRIPYRVDVLSPEQQQYLLPYFALIGLVYMVLYSLFSRYQKTLDSIPFFYATNLGMDFLTVTPGIRLASDSVNDQKRVTTPAMARELTSSYIVVGRTITNAVDPVATYKEVYKQFQGE